MTEFIGGVFSSIFGTHSIIATMIISMLPIIELKGAIPIGMSEEYWGEFALSSAQAFWVSLLGSSFVVPVLALIFIPVLSFLKKTRIFKKIACFIEEKVNKQKQTIVSKLEGKKSKRSTFLKCLFIFLFVADPFPFTGVWTGTCVGVMLGLSFTQICLSVILGNIVAGSLVTIICNAFPEFATIFSLTFFGIIVIMLLWFLIKFILNKKLRNKEKIGVETCNIADNKESN